jgi:predicted metallo-beta-lactamase superfamily hydrolase
MPPLKVAPLYFESLRVRSSALIIIESDDPKTALDTAVALAPTLHEFEGGHRLAGDLDYRGRRAPVLGAGRGQGSPQSF